MVCRRPNTLVPCWHSFSSLSHLIGSLSRFSFWTMVDGRTDFYHSAAGGLGGGVKGDRRPHAAVA